MITRLKSGFFCAAKQGKLLTIHQHRKKCCADKFLKAIGENPLNLL